MLMVEFSTSPNAANTGHGLNTSAALALRTKSRLRPNTSLGRMFIVSSPCKRSCSCLPRKRLLYPLHTTSNRLFMNLHLNCRLHRVTSTGFVSLPCPQLSRFAAAFLALAFSSCCFRRRRSYAALVVHESHEQEPS